MKGKEYDDQMRGITIDQIDVHPEEEKWHDQIGFSTIDQVDVRTGDG